MATAGSAGPAREATSCALRERRALLRRCVLGPEVEHLRRRTAGDEPESSMTLPRQPETLAELHRLPVDEGPQPGDVQNHGPDVVAARRQEFEDRREADGGTHKIDQIEHAMTVTRAQVHDADLVLPENDVGDCPGNVVDVYIVAHRGAVAEDPESESCRQPVEEDATAPWLRSSACPGP